MVSSLVQCTLSAGSTKYPIDRHTTFTYPSEKNCQPVNAIFVRFMTNVWAMNTFSYILFYLYCLLITLIVCQVVEHRICSTAMLLWCYLLLMMLYYYLLFYLLLLVLYTIFSSFTMLHCNIVSMSYNEPHIFHWQSVTVRVWNIIALSENIHIMQVMRRWTIPWNSYCLYHYNINNPMI